MKMDSYIHFDNPTAIYSGGQVVSGKVEINLKRPKKIRSIRIVLKGKAAVLWHERKHDHHHHGDRARKHSRSETYYSKEQYFKETFVVFGAHNVGEAIDLPAGQHIYPFQYILPKFLPPSFESHYGNIRYSVKAILDRPWKFDKKIKSPFVIEAPPDFMDNPRTNEPACLTMEKTFGFLMFKSNPLKGTLRIPNCGFICGQSIPAILEINNMSSVAVKGIRFELNKIKKFRATHPRPHEKVEIKHIWKSQVDCYIESNCLKTMQENIQVPHFDIFNMTHCSIIDIDYEIKVEVQTVGLHLNMYGNLAIYPRNSILENMGSTNFYPVNNNQPPISTNLAENSQYADRNKISEMESNNFGAINNVQQPTAPTIYPSTPSITNNPSSINIGWNLPHQ